MQVAVLIVITASSTLFYLALLIMVLAGGAWRGVNRVFAYYLFSSLIWNLGGLLMFLDPQRDLLWNRVMVLGLLAVFFTFFHFVLVFLNIKGNRALLYLGYALFAIIGSFNLAGLVITEVTIAEGRFEYEIGPAMPAVFIAGYIYLGLSMFYLARSYRAIPDEFYRNKIRYPILGLIVMLVSGATNAVPAVGAYGIDHIGNLIMAVTVGYAILRYKLLDLRFVIRSGVVYSTVTIVITAVYLVLVYSLTSAFPKAGYTITALVVAIFVAVVFLPMRDLIQRWVDRLFFREKYDYQNMLRLAGRAMAEILDLQELAGTLMGLIGNVIHTRKMSLFLLEGNAYVCSPRLRRGYAEQDGEFKLAKDSPIVAYLAARGGVLRIEELEALPEFRGLWYEAKELLQVLEVVLFLPLKARGQLVGTLALGPKLTAESYSADDIDLLSTLASNMGIAVDNARLFEEARRSYEELKSAQGYLVQSERLRALGQMASGVAHDFNNLLAAILGRAQLALGIAKEEKVIRNLKIIEEVALGGADTVRRLQTFTRVRADQDFTTVDLNEIVESALRIVEPQRAERQQVSGTQIDVIARLGKVGPVLGSAGELRDALTNIALNGVEAMPKGGTLTVETRQEGDQGVVSISDTGIGISEEAKRRIFEPFYTTKGARGSGLGLSVAYAVVTRHGGTIEVDSQVNKGSTFRIKLPVTAGQVVESKPPVILPRAAREASLLLVDDDREVGEVMRLMLLDEGYKVIQVSTGKEALASFRQNDYDLVITDLGMPDISGKEVAREIHAIKPKIPIILITGWSVQLDSQEMAETGIDQIIAKPFTREGLLFKVARLLSRAG